MIRLTRATTMAFSMVVLVMAVSARDALAQTNQACGLVTDAEIQSVLGSKVTLKAGSLGTAQTCSGETPAAKALVRFFTRTGDPGGKTEQAGLEAMKKMGGQVDVQTANGITCVTAVPPANMAAMGYITSCTVMAKAPMIAVIEITAKAQKDLVPIEKLRAVAEKMASRF